MSTIGSASHMEKLGVIHGQRDEIERIRAVNAALERRELDHIDEAAAAANRMRKLEAVNAALVEALTMARGTVLDYGDSAMWDALCAAIALAKGEKP